MAIEFDFIGRVIGGRYTVRAHIGGGGMADVYQATDEQLGIEVAIKLLKPRMASDELRARMVQEAQAAAQIRHANLVRVFGTGALDSTAFIAMELLNGPNLEQHLRTYHGERMPCGEALDLLLPALDALHEIHERGYVHRDIKTGNILVARAAGRPATAIVIDLGLVKPDRALRNAASPPTTEVGRMLCTPGYTSPEQAAGRPVDRRSDIYSMAVTLYRVLAGRLPFHDARGQPYALLAKHIYNEPTMLAEAAGTADIPVGVAAVVEGALSKDPARRPQTMLAFAEALRAAAPSACSPRGPRVRQSWQLLLGIGVGLMLAWWVTPSPTCPPAVAAAAMSAAAPMPARNEPAPAPMRDEPALLTVLEAEPMYTSADAPPEDAATPALHNTARPTSRRSKAANGRALEGHAAEIQACADRGAGGFASLAVAMTIDIAGRVSAHVVGDPNTPLSRCIDAALRRTFVATPGEPMFLTHTFSLQPSRR